MVRHRSTGSPHPLELNLWALNRDYARVPGATVHDDPDLLWYTIPGTNSWLNGASRCQLGRDAEARVDDVVATWRALGTSVQWHQTPSSSPPRLGRLLEARGFEPTVEPGMALQLEGNLELPPSGLVVDPIVDAAGVFEWANTFDVAFGGTPRGDRHPWLAAFAALYLGDAATGRLFIGRVDGVPVATSLAFDGGGAVGIYGVGTVPEHRGRGYGAAITVAALAWGRRRGARMGVLEATELGFPVYRRLGFETVFQTTAWLRRVTLAPPG